MYRSVLSLIFLACLALIFPSSAEATRKYDACFERAGQHFSISPLLLRAIARQESGFNARAINRANFNDSEDRGLMQINSFWFPTLRRAGIDPETLFDPCVSIAVGAWILAGEIRKHGMTWEAVGRYNARSEHKKRRYAAKIQRNLLLEIAYAEAHQASMR